MNATSRLVPRTALIAVLSAGAAWTGTGIAAPTAAAEGGVKSSSAVLCGSRIQILAATIRDGRALLYEYRQTAEGVPRPTGLIVASADYRSFTSLCSPAGVARLRRAPVTIGPWPRFSPNLITCGVPRTGLRVQADPIRSKSHIAIGTRLRIARGRTTLVDVTLRRRAGGISYDFQSCSRNSYPAP